MIFDKNIFVSYIREIHQVSLIEMHQTIEGHVQKRMEVVLRSNSLKRLDKPNFIHPVLNLSYYIPFIARLEMFLDASLLRAQRRICFYQIAMHLRNYHV